MRILDTWIGDITSPRQQQGKPDDYRNVKVPAPAVERGAPVANPPKPIEARWVIGFSGMDCKPYAVLHCTCKTDTTFELGGTGVAPVARCCKNAPAYPQDRKHTAHLLATGTALDDSLRVRVAQPGLPPEPGFLLYTEPRPSVETSFAQDAEFINKLVDLDMASAARDGAAIDAARKEHKQ